MENTFLKGAATMAGYLRLLLAASVIACISAERIYVDSEDKIRGRVLASDTVEDDIFDEGDTTEDATVYQQVEARSR